MLLYWINSVTFTIILFVLQVSSDGKYTSSGPNKAIYATMVLVRVKMTKWVHDALRKAITTAVRYSAVRHQSKMDDR